MTRAKYRIYGRFLFAYFVVITILIAGIIPVYSYYVQNLREKETNKVIYTLENGIERLEKTIVDLSWALTSLEEDFTYQRLTTKSESLTPRELYAAMQVQKRFAVSIRNIDLVDYAFLSFLNNDIILDAERVYRNNDNFYGAFLSYDEQAYTSVDDIRLAAKSAVLPCQRITIRTRGTTLQGEYMTLLFSDGFGQNTQNTIFAYFERNDLLSLLLGPDIVAQGGLVHIENSAGETILTHNPSGMAFGPEIKNIESIGRNISLLGLTVHVGLPESIYAGDLWQAVQRVVVYAAIALFFSTIASFLLAYRNAKPIQNAFERIQDIGMDVDNGKGDAFGFIGQALDAINMDRNKLSTELNSYEKRLRHQIIEGMLNGFTDYEDAPKGSIRLAKRNRLLLFGASRFTSSQWLGDDWDGTYGELESFVLLNLIKDALHEDTIVHETGDRDIAVILPCDDPTAGSDEAVQEMVQSVLAVLKDTLGAQPRVAISRVFDGPAALSREYMHTKNALEASLFESKPIIWLPDEEPAKAYQDLTPAVINQIYELMMMGAYDRLMAVLDLVFSSEVLMSTYFKQAFYSVRGCLLAVCYKAQYDAAGFDPERLDYDPKKSNHELLAELQESCRLLCQFINSRKISQNHQLVDGILAYINENYTDSQLSATTIASHFNISSKYMSQFIKSETGRTYSEYLENIRLENALQLLKDQSINVTQIATQVGFANQNTFYKAFRRVYKVSPSAWRSGGTPEDTDEKP